MSIPNSVYPSDYFGPMGLIKCTTCGTEIDEDYAHEVDAGHELLCDDCYEEYLLELEEENNDDD